MNPSSVKPTDMRKIASGSPSLKFPDKGYKKTGLITKIYTSDENRDMLAGRKKVMRKQLTK